MVVSVAINDVLPPREIISVDFRSTLISTMLVENVSTDEVF